MQNLVQQFAEARLAEVQTTLAYAGALLQRGSLAPPSDAQLAALLSTLGLVAAINVTLTLLVPRGRKLVLDTVETVLAIALLVVLIVTVLGLPLAIIYLVLKAVAFLLNVLLSIPAISGLLASARSVVGL
ncbi:hypothetical protein ABPG75_006802 [Micractinium tetrahymenae]